jgi:hypothetical protein
MCITSEMPSFFTGTERDSFLVRTMTLLKVGRNSGLPDGIFSNQKSKFEYIHFGGSCNERCWYILWAFVLFYGHVMYVVYGHLVYFVVIWYIFPRFGMLCQEKSGNPGVISFL